MTTTNPTTASPDPNESSPDRRRSGRRWLIASATALVAVGAVAAVYLPADSQETSAPAEYGLDDLQRDTDAIEALGVVGVQARLTSDTGPDLVATSGVAEVDTDNPVPDEGHFRMASTGKSLVAAAVLQLVDEGELTLDDTVDQWLPGAVDGNGIDGGRITVRHLLQHTAGLHDDLPGYETPEEYLEHRYDDALTPEEIVERSMGHAPDFPPGEAWGYSNTGYVLLEMIIEEATGNPWHQEIEDRILAPLGMGHTYLPGDDPALRDPHANAYEVFPSGELVDVTEVIVPGSGGYVTTTADVNRFFGALLGGELLTEASLAEMRDTVPVGEEMQAFWPEGAYGLGLVERPLSCGGAYWSHEGGESGYITLNGATDDGARTVTVSMSTALGDSFENMLAQEQAASDLVDNALCAASGDR